MRREQETKKVIGSDFIDDGQAILAATHVAMYFAIQGYLVSSYLSKEVSVYTVTIHRDTKEDIELPKGYIATTQEDITYVEETGERMAVTKFNFKVTEK